MARAIVMPSMGMYTEEGVLTAWLRPTGTRVALGEPVAEITTEKATFEVAAPEAGILHPLAAVGTALRVEILMGYILSDGEAVPASPAGKISPTPKSGMTVDALPAAIRDVPPQGLLRATPVAKRLAAEHGIDLKRVIGSGPGGRIVEADILTLVSTRDVTTQISKENLGADRTPLVGLRRTLAERLRTTLATAASTTLTREANADLLVAARRSLSVKLGVAPSYDALFIKLFAAALHERPELNAVIENASIVRLPEINIGFAVAVPNSLIVPVIRNADSTPLGAIVGAVKDLTERALAGRLQPAHVEAGTATISNLGSYGVDAFTPILNGSQSAILGIGRIAQRPVMRNAELAVGHTCVLSLTFDHRVADGVPAALLLDALVRRMNDEAFLNSLADQ